MKLCKTCGLLKEDHWFFKNAFTRDGLMNPCKDCRKTVDHERYERCKLDPMWKVNKARRDAEWEARNPEKKRAKARRNYTTQKGRIYNLRNNYGLELNDYEKLFASQEGRCALCRKHERECVTKTQHKLFVDHSHATGKVRGLLCIRCNSILGSVEEARKLQAAIDIYLSQDWPEYCI